MKYRKLGNSELQVSEICLGSWLTFGSGIADEQAIACVERAFEAGINFIDTANVYGRGAAESFLGRVLKDRSRDSYVLATKVYFPMTSQDSGLSRVQIFKQLDASLARQLDGGDGDGRLFSLEATNIPTPRRWHNVSTQRIVSAARGSR